MRRLLVLLFVACFCWPAWAQSSWPTKAVRIVVPFPPGGSVDGAARLVAQRLQTALGQPVLVENRAGAAGSVGSEYVAKAEPNGYTLVWGTVSSHAINMSLYPKLRYDSLRDFAPITLLTEQPLMVVVPVSSRITSMAELIAALRKDESFNVGSPGVGSTGHLTTEFIKSRIGGRITHVGYKGSNPMLTDLVGGHIEMGIDNLPSSLALVKAGKLRALAVTSDKPSTFAPGVPTLNEYIPGLAVVAWQGLFAPAGTPEDVLNRLEREVIEILNQPDIRSRLTEFGNRPVGSPRSAFTAFVKAETIRWAEIVKTSGARADE